LQKLQDELSAVTSDNQQIQSQKVDYSVRMEGIIGALPEGADYRQIDMQSTSFVVSGTAQDPFDVIAYTQKLEDQEYFPTVRVTEISATEDPAEVTFGVTAPN
jgi:Tfp pilus assembly protein PilN